MYSSAALFFVLIFITSMAFPYELIGTVVSITDGDTLKLLVDNQQHKIRLAEIDTPEKGQPWGKNATEALAILLERRAYPDHRAARSIGGVLGTTVEACEVK